MVDYKNIHSIEKFQPVLIKTIVKLLPPKHI